MHKVGERGDTIVEVLISLAVLGLVVAGAFSITNAALRNSRQAQERSEATKIAESQLESLKASQMSTPPATAFCMNGTSTQTISETPPENFNDDTFAVYGACGGLGTNQLYHVFIDHAVDAYGVDIYTANVRWERLGGGREQIVMVYKGYQP